MSEGRGRGQEAEIWKVRAEKAEQQPQEAKDLLLEFHKKSIEAYHHELKLSWDLDGVPCSRAGCTRSSNSSSGIPTLTTKTAGSR